MRCWVLVAVLASCGRIGFDEVGTSSGDAASPSFPRLIVASGPGTTFLDDVSIDDQGKLAVIGNFDQTLTLGGGSVTSGASNLDLFVGAVAADDTKQWLWNGGCSVLCTAQGVNWLGNGVVGGGYLDGTLVNGGGLMSETGQDAIVTWFAATGGPPAPVQKFGGIRNVQVRGLDSNGSLVAFGGLYADMVDFGPGPLPSTAVDNAFIAAFGTDRTFKFQYSYNGPADVYVNDIAVGADGSVCVAGRNATTTNFGGGAVTANGSADGFVVRYDAQGNFSWFRVTPGSGNEGAANVAVAPNGDCVVVGYYLAAQTWDSVPLPFDGIEEAFIVRLEAATGFMHWVRTVHGPGLDGVNGVAVDKHDRIAVLGNFENTSTIVDRTLTSQGAGDAFLLLLDGRGDVLSLQQLGGAGGIISSGGGVAFDPSGTHVASAFSFTGELTVVGTTLAATAQGQDGAVFVMPTP